MPSHKYITLFGATGFSNPGRCRRRAVPEGVVMFARALRRFFRSPSPRTPDYRRRLAVESLEQRAMLSIVAGLPVSPAAQGNLSDSVQAGSKAGNTSASQSETLADLPVTEQVAISTAIGQDQSAYHVTSGASGAPWPMQPTASPPSFSQECCRLPPGRTIGKRRWWVSATAERSSRWEPLRPRSTATAWMKTMGRSTNGTSTVPAVWNRALT